MKSTAGGGEFVRRGGLAKIGQCSWKNWMVCVEVVNGNPPENAKMYWMADEK